MLLIRRWHAGGIPRRMAATLAVSAVALLTAIAAPGSATAAPGAILISTDGSTWQTGAVAGPLPAAGPLVPGASETWTIQVRNASSFTAGLQLALRVDDGAPALLGHLGLSATVDQTAGPVVTPSLGTCRTLLDGPVLAPGETVVVDVEIHLAADAPNAAQGTHAHSTIYASLVENAGGASPDATCAAGPPDPIDPDGDATIARTGQDGTAIMPLLVGAVVAIACGALIARRRAPDSVA